uniref:Sulfotransferase domain-containing protein n=1 Tax=Clastoptera arizonana TaxID=38151 RepID=A0A1B6D0J8_9HEMI
MRQLIALRCCVFFVLSVSVIIYVYGWHKTTNSVEEARRKLLSLPDVQIQTISSSLISESNERTDIFFLKAHKCASSTLQNIFLRFGYSRELDFVLPHNNNYIGSPQHFKKSMIVDDLTSSSGKYNIFTHHTRYSFEQMKAVMKEGAAFVTILRDPTTLFESIYSYYSLNKAFNLSFDDLLRNPYKIHKFNHRYLKKIGLNQMSFDLGMPEEFFNLDAKIQYYINKIDNEFELVMISEYIEASLVLLCDLMNWPLENVIFLKLNSRPDISKHILTDNDRDVIRKFNHADTMLYDYFLNKFRNQIKDYGEERMEENISKLIHLNNNFSYRCVDGINLKGYGHTKAYNLRHSDDWLCYYAARPYINHQELKLNG